uniref:Uncharacterized protein n=1 Tax=Canis lupus familiaris TaxID=9615 RepID=A0A8P0NQF0_CANLF
MQLTRRKLLRLGVFGRGARRSSALRGGVGGGRSWAARGLHGPPSARRRGMASAARGAAELGASAGQGPPGCTWLRPAPPESAAPARLLGPPGRADRGSSGVCRALYAFRSLAGSLCKPSGVGRTAGGAVGPGTRSRAGRRNISKRSRVCFPAGSGFLFVCLFLNCGRVRVWRGCLSGVGLEVEEGTEKGAGLVELVLNY